MNKLDIYKNQDYILNDAFDQAVVNIHIQKEQNGYKTYTVCGCEPGDGSTTVAINLAAALANSGWKTVLVDGDMRRRRAINATAIAVKTDACILVVAMGESSKKGLATAVSTLDEKRANLLGVIVNKVDINEYKRYRRSFDYFKKEKYADHARSVMKANKKNNRKNA